MHRLLPFSSLSACTHGGIVAEDVRLKCCIRDGGENPAGLLPELGPAAGGDSKAEVMAVQGAEAVPPMTYSFQQLKNLFLGVVGEEMEGEQPKSKFNKNRIDFDQKKNVYI